MKIHFAIDLQDVVVETFGDEGAFNLNDELKLSIKHEVLTEIKSMVRETTTKQITEEVKELVANSIPSFVDKFFTENLQEGIVLQGRHSIINKQGKEQYQDTCTLEEWIITQLFKGSHYGASLEKKIATSASEVTKQINARYDMLFASQIVHNLSKAGMLKEGIADTLLKASNDSD